jgi:hypothetical protein
METVFSVRGHMGAQHYRVFVEQSHQQFHPE